LSHVRYCDAVSNPNVAPVEPPRHEKVHDLCGIGSPLIDYVSTATLEVVASLGIEPGAMTLIDGATAAKVRAAVGNGQLVSGGTVANTAAGVASLGGAPVYVGAVAADDLGERYAADLESAGVRSVLELIATDDGELGTGASYIIVTPDKQRTMATSLGVSGLLHAAAIDVSTVGVAEVVYFDGYLLDFSHSEAIVERIIEIAAASGTKVALGLADPFVVGRHFDRLSALAERVDVLFSNEDEAKAMTGATTAEGAIEALRRLGRVTVVTCGPRGALLASDGGVVSVPPVPVDVVDVTGAGDLFAAGVCFGLTHDLGIEGAGALGAICAAEAISHMGARPATSLVALATGAGLL
jgi:sugar/nucleoside kinase (ribokinase family)